MCLFQNAVVHLVNRVFLMEGAHKNRRVTALRQHDTGSIQHAHIFDLTGRHDFCHQAIQGRQVLRDHRVLGRDDQQFGADLHPPHQFGFV